MDSTGSWFDDEDLLDVSSLSFSDSFESNLFPIPTNIQRIIWPGSKRKRDVNHGASKNKIYDSELFTKKRGKLTNIEFRIRIYNRLIQIVLLVIYKNCTIYS